MGKSIKIPGRFESAETGNIVAGADAIKDDVRGKTQYVVNNELEAAILQLGESKQNKLTFDQTPTEDSPNPVTSGGVYAADQVLSQAIEAILLLIPSAASALNKLVDMQTMNSSIATATASFKGTYNLVSDLHLTVDATHVQIGAALDALSLGADNNDYAFVQVPNTDTAPTEIAKTERYKFNGTGWSYEYDLNNSGFTSAQWNAINSGITELLVSKLSALPTNEALVAALAGKQDNLTFDNVPTAGSPNPVKSGGVYARNNEIVALINALDDAKQDVLTFDNAPVEGSPNPVKSGGVYMAISAVQAAIVALDAAKQNVLTFDSTPTLGSPNPVTSSGIKTELNRIDGNITTLNDLYEALTQSALVVVQPTDTWPVENPEEQTIYRVVDRANTPPQYYSDYMWNGSAMVLMAEYDNAIDDVPTAGSNNLVKSGGTQLVDTINTAFTEMSSTVFENFSGATDVTFATGILKSNGTIDASFTGFKTSELVSPNTLIFVYPSFFGISEGSFLNLAYYKLESSEYKFVYGTRNEINYGQCILVPYGLYCRITLINDGSYAKKVSNAASLSKINSAYYAANKSLHPLNEAQFKSYQDNIKLGTKLTPSSVLDNRYISEGLTIVSVNGFKVKIYNIESYRNKAVCIAGKVGYSIPSAVYSFSDNGESPSVKLDFLALTGERRVKNLIYVPLNAKYLFIQQDNNYNLDFPEIYEYDGMEDTVIASKTEMTPVNTLDRKYMPNNNLADIGDSSFHVDIYEVSAYANKKVIIDGIAGAEVTTTIYTFSEASDSITSVSGFVAQGKKIYENVEVNVPSNASYMFVERINDNTNPIKVYAPVINDHVITELSFNEKRFSKKIMGSDVVVCPVYGQSLAIGGEAYPVVTDKIKYPFHQIGTNLQIAPLPSETEKSYIGVEEGLIKFFCKYHNLDISMLKTKVCSFNSGVGSSSIDSLKKGTTAYSNLIAQITGVYNLCQQKYGFSCKVPAIAWIQGEEDTIPGGYVQDYKAVLLQLQSDLEDDVQAVTGQTEAVPLVLYQTNQLNIARQINPSAYTVDHLDVFKAQEELLKEYPMRFIASSPIYMMNFYTSGNGLQIHIDGYAQKLLGYYIGKAITAHCVGDDAHGLVVDSVTAKSSDPRKVFVNFRSDTVIVKDIETVMAASGYGFNVVNQNNENIVSSVELQRNRVMITTSEDVTANTKVRYAVNGEQQNKAGWYNGPRGNIRDIQGVGYVAEVAGRQIPCNNWLYGFEKLVTLES